MTGSTSLQARQDAWESAGQAPGRQKPAGHGQGERGLRRLWRGTGRNRKAGLAPQRELLFGVLTLRFPDRLVGAAILNLGAECARSKNALSSYGVGELRQRRFAPSRARICRMEERFLRFPTKLGITGSGNSKWEDGRGDITLKSSSFSSLRGRVLSQRRLRFLAGIELRNFWVCSPTLYPRGAVWKSVISAALRDVSRNGSQVALAKCAHPRKKSIDVFY